MTTELVTQTIEGDIQIRDSFNGLILYSTMGANIPAKNITSYSKVTISSIPTIARVILIIMQVLSPGMII